MEKQKIFRSTYISKLKKNLLNGKTVHLYKEKEFEYDKEKELILPTVFKPEGLLNKMNEKDDLKSAIALYEAYCDFTPIQASDDRFWTYLTHVDLFSYMQKRRNKHLTGEADNEIEYIMKYWFMKSTSQQELMRHSLAGLWWGVYLSVDETRENKYELTNILFRQLDFPTRTLGTYRLGRHKEAVIGILQFILENDELFNSKFEKKTRYITKYLNLVGGTKPLGYFDRTFYINELNKIKTKISQI
ncbi:MAG: hypothetical protein GXO49_04300 [Chlorobi bacterium]|nr:hypothetical protein [Chlorobiota bacterium]